MEANSSTPIVPLNGYHKDDGTSATSKNPIRLGTTFVDKTVSPAKKYIWAQVAQSLTNSTFAANEVAVASSASTLELTNVDASGVGYSNGGSVGACRANAAIPTSTSTITYYGWFQIGGFATIKTNGDNDGVAGDYYTPSGNGTCNVVVDSVTNSTEAVSHQIFARAVGSESASACAVWLVCPDYAGL